MSIEKLIFLITKLVVNCHVIFLTFSILPFILIFFLGMCGRGPEKEIPKSRGVFPYLSKFQPNGREVLSLQQMLEVCSLLYCLFIRFIVYFQCNTV